MPKPNKTDKKLQKHTGIAEQTGAASDGEANQDGEANTATQHDTLSQSIAFFAGELQELKKDIKRDIGELRHEGRNDESSNRHCGFGNGVSGNEGYSHYCNETKPTNARCNKIVDLESRGRRNNLRIYGVPEEKEGKSMLDFVSDLFKTHIKLPEGVQLQIQWAHRALIPQPALTAAPRSIIVAFLQFQVKELVLRKVWQQKIELDGKRLYFDNDFASDVVEKRKAYGPIKAALKSKGIRFNTPYTKMRVFWENGTRGYESADEAAQDLIRRGLLSTWTVRVDRRAEAEDRLNELMPWKRIQIRDTGAGQRARERLTEFHRSDQ
ncbi:hypothetical protein WMY93_002399 [Mugilogobius chulae]|uniref:L1 transposable element RRM domain-containing protein n=1 Tax=Mugilogobius chulae TaxID=88201 RepID=A0AAW0PV90_9GOBI